jgi:prepilin-type N-terminal cleavage/methylation domain-containing protein
MAHREAVTAEPVAPNRRDAGFSMIELLVTMLLLAIVLVGLAALQVTTIRQVTGSKLSSQASQLAQMVLSRHETRPFADLLGFTPQGTWVRELKKDTVTEMKQVGVDGESQGPFTVDTLVETVGGGVLINVRVTWTSLHRGVESTPSQQYRQFKVTMSLQRFQ